MKRAALVFLILTIALTAAAQVREFRGVVYGTSTLCGITTPVPIPTIAGVRTGTPRINSMMTLQGLAPGPHGELYATFGSIWELTRNPPRRIVEVGGVQPITVARDGTIYVIDRTSSTLRAYTDGGTLLDVWAVPASTFYSLDLAADQCTMYVGTLNAISRVSVCGHAASEPVLSNLPTFVGFRLLPNGDFLVNHYHLADGLVRYAPDGTVVRRYQKPQAGFRGLAISADLRSFWTSQYSCGNARMVEFDLESGAILTDELPPFMMMQFSEFVVLSYGWTAALGVYGGAEATAGDIPSLSTFGMAALAALLVGFAVLRLR